MIEDGEVLFIQKNFKIRTCEKYAGESYERCTCNRLKGEHTVFPNSVKEWSHEENTVLKTCDTYGRILFTGLNDILVSHCPKFIRFDCINQPDIYQCVFLLLVNYWSVPPPKLIISVNGGFKRMTFRTNMVKKNFKQGLIEVIKKNSTWIIGGGFNVGIHKLVSEAVHEYRLHQERCDNEVTLIGIASWGVVYNNKVLLPNSDGHTPTQQIQTFKYPNNSSNERGKVALDPHYDCYLFCDDGTDKKYDKEVLFRMELEKYVASKDDSFIVQILYEGGTRALYSAHNTLKNKVSLVVIKGSGRAADIISAVMELPSRTFEQNIGTIIDDHKEKMVIQDDEMDKIKQILSDMFENFKKQIIIHDMYDPNMKLDKSILEAIISGRDEKNLKKILQLTIRFNCPNLAEKKVFSNSSYAEIKQGHINNMFLNVIQKNQFEFVRLFLQNGLEIERLVSKGKLENLYYESLDVQRSDCFQLLQDLMKSDLEKGEKKKYRHKIEDYVILRGIGAIIPFISGNILKSRYKKEVPKKNSSSSMNTDIELFPPSTTLLTSVVTAQDLFLWALLSGHIELAHIFWEVGKDQVGSALIAATVLKNMASLTLKRGDLDLELRLTKASQNFQDCATNIISEAYARSKSKTYDMLVRALERWDNMTCIQIAISGNLLDFLNNSACRSYAMKVWMGNMSPFLSYWKILINIPLSLIFMKPLIIPLLDTEEEFIHPPIFRKDGLESYADNQLMLGSQKSKRMKAVPFKRAIGIFYKAPIVKFTINIMSYVMFLIIFSYMNLCELKPSEELKSIKDMWAEIFVCVYVVSLIIEEFRQIIDQERTGNIIYKFIAYLKGPWNIYDILLILLFVCSVITRYSIQSEDFIICRCLFGASLSMFCLRTMQFYFVNKSIGPKVIMIRDMIRDILFFLSIFAIFILSYGTLAHSLHSPNSKFDILLLKDIVYLPYFQTYGELMLEKIEKSCNTTNCMIANGTIIIGFGIFLLLTNVLLINLLIAMFGYTFNQIQGNSAKHWSFIKIQLIEEFYEKPILPPPLNLIYYLFKLFSLIFNKTRTTPRKSKNNLLVKSLTKDEHFQISNYEQFCMETTLSEIPRYQNAMQNSANSEIDNWIRNMTQLLESFTATQENIQKMNTNLFTRAPSIQMSINKRFGNFGETC